MLRICRRRGHPPRIEVAVISGDATDHALEMHNPAVERLERQVVKLRRALSGADAARHLLP